MKRPHVTANTYTQIYVHVILAVEGRYIIKKEYVRHEAQDAMRE